MAFVETWMNFAGDIKGRARVDVPDWSRTNLVLDKHDVRIFDGRPERESLSFDREGFRLLDHPSPMDADCDLKAEAAGYLESVGTLLKEATGAGLERPAAAQLGRHPGPARGRRPAGQQRGQVLRLLGVGRGRDARATTPTCRFTT